jgi:hypothetical protein
MITKGFWFKAAVITLFVTGFSQKTYADYNIPFTPANNQEYRWCTTEFQVACSPYPYPFAWFDAYWQSRDWDSANQMCVVLNHFPYYKIWRTQASISGVGCNGITIGLVFCSTSQQTCSASESTYGCWTQPPNPLPPLPGCN